MSTKKRKAAVVDGDHVQGESDRHPAGAAAPAPAIEQQRSPFVLLEDFDILPPTMGGLRAALESVAAGQLGMHEFAEMLERHLAAVADCRSTIARTQQELQRLLSSDVAAGLDVKTCVEPTTSQADVPRTAAAAAPSAVPAAPTPAPLGAGPGQQALPGADAAGSLVSVAIRNGDGTRTPVVPAAAAVLIDSERWKRMWDILRLWSTKAGVPLDVQDEEIRTYIHRQAGVQNTKHVTVEAYEQLVEIEGAEERFLAAVAPTAGGS